MSSLGIVLSALAALGPVESPDWTLLGPVTSAGPVSVASVAVNRLTGTLYAGSDSVLTASLVFQRSEDGGGWFEVNSPELGGLSPSVHIWVDATGAVYAGGGSCVMRPPGCGGGLARTEDGGAVWTRVLDKVAPALATDPFDPSILLAVYYELVPDPMFPGHATTVATRIRSLDRGSSWQRIPVSASAFAFDATRPGVVLAATPNEGAWRSVDSGASWQSANDGISDLGTRTVAVDGLGDAYLATQSAVFVSHDGGLHWSESALTVLASVLQADPSRGGGAYVATDAAVFHLDASGRLSPVGSALSHVRGLALGERHLWAATTEGVFELELHSSRPRPRIAPTRPAAGAAGVAAGGSARSAPLKRP